MCLATQAVSMPIRILPDHSERRSRNGLTARLHLQPDRLERTVAVQIHLPEPCFIGVMRAVAEIPACPSADFFCGVKQIGRSQVVKHFENRRSWCGGMRI